MKVNIQELLALYDTPQSVGGFATAISALGGEELGIGLLQHFLVAQGKDVRRIPGFPRMGQRSGRWLDGWLLVDGELIQIEVKNRTANATGWSQFLAWYREPRANLRKVLFPMEPPSGYTSIHHCAVIVWPMMYPAGNNTPWFSVALQDLPPLGSETPFKRLHIFSMSGYLRSLEGPYLDLPMPLLEERLHRLTNLFHLE